MISVQIYCCKCKQDVMKAAAGVDGIYTSASNIIFFMSHTIYFYCWMSNLYVMHFTGVESIQVDSSKGTVTVIGEADPVEVAKKIRKFQKNAGIVTVKTAG